MNLIPARYAKFIASLAGVFILYIEMYGAVWHFVPAMLSLFASLGVMGVPNKQPPATPPIDLPTAVTALRVAASQPSPAFGPPPMQRPPIPPNTTPPAA